MEFSEVIVKRYSCKKFDGRQISDAQLTAILEAGRLAPTAKNMQEQKIYVIRSEAGLKIVDSVSPCRYNAPTVLAVAFDKNSVYKYPGSERTSDAEDATIAATHMMLAAANTGVDSCWLNCFNPDEAEKALGLPENERISMLLDLGFADDGAGPLPNHFSRKPLSETVLYK